MPGAHAAGGARFARPGAARSAIEIGDSPAEGEAVRRARASTCIGEAGARAKTPATLAPSAGASHAPSDGGEPGATSARCVSSRDARELADSLLRRGIEPELPPSPAKSASASCVGARGGAPIALIASR